MGLETDSDLDFGWFGDNPKNPPERGQTVKMLGDGNASTKTDNEAKKIPECILMTQRPTETIDKEQQVTNPDESAVMVCSFTWGSLQVFLFDNSNFWGTRCD